MRIFYGQTAAVQSDIMADFKNDPLGILVVLNEIRRNDVIRSLAATDDVKARIVTFESARNENFRNARATRFHIYLEDAPAFLRAAFMPHEIRAAWVNDATPIVESEHG